MTYLESDRDKTVRANLPRHHYSRPAPLSFRALKFLKAQGIKQPQNNP